MRLNSDTFFCKIISRIGFVDQAKEGKEKFSEGSDSKIFGKGKSRNKRFLIFQK